MDFDVDGVKNNLYELNVRPISESRGYAEQNTFTLERTLFSPRTKSRSETSMKCKTDAGKWSTKMRHATSDTLRGI